MVALGGSCPGVVDWGGYLGVDVQGVSVLEPSDHTDNRDWLVIQCVPEKPKPDFMAEVFYYNE